MKTRNLVLAIVCLVGSFVASVHAQEQTEKKVPAYAPSVPKPTLTLVFVVSVAGISADKDVDNPCNQPPVKLMCDYRVNPLAVEQVRPGLSWRIECHYPGAEQSAYRIQAARSQEQLPEASLWDSGWVESAETTQVLYEGRPIPPTTRVYWRVQIKDGAGFVSPWSESAWFESGLRDEAQWQGARWISSTQKRSPELAPEELMGPWVRHLPENAPEEGQPLSYHLNLELPDKPVVYAGAWWGAEGNARIECRVNGESADHTFARGAHSIDYMDFGFYLRPGENLVALNLPESPAEAAVTFGMHIVFADGTEQRVRSSEQWTADGKPVRKVAKYGEAPFGVATVHSMAPLPAAWYKQDFSVDKPVDTARLYVCGLGYHDPYLNGAKVGDHVLDPGQADYEEYALYQAFDVTGHVQQGANALSILLGDGWYNQDRGFTLDSLRYGDPGLRALLHVQFADGSVQNIITDEGWQWRESGTTMSNVYLGDHIDLRLEHDEWKRPGFSSDWKAAKVVPPLSPRLVAQDFEPMRRIRTIQPVRTWQTGAQSWAFDLGQNITGWVRLNIDEPEGRVIRVRCSEMASPDGTKLLNVPSSFWWCHGAPQHHEIISDGKAHSWEPRFSYHGFRYFEVSGLSRAPKSDDIVGVVVNTDVAPTASFESSDPLLDRIFKMGVQTHFNNMHSVLEDCPHREKCMWGGDLHASWSLGFHGLASTAFYRQQVNLYYTPPFSPSGVPGNIGVGKRITKGFNDFSWPVSPLFLAYRLYEVDGELETARKNYEPMHSFLKYFEEHAPGLIPEEAKHGDHAAPVDIERVPQDKRLIAALNFFAAANRFAVLADALEKPDGAAWARDLAGRIRASIIEKYYDADKHTFGNGTHDSLALAFDLPAPEDRAAVAESLARVYRENGKKFDGGFMSYHIYPQLAENGEVDLALEMLRNPNYPGLAWSIAEFDATTIWETFTLDKERREHISLDHHAMNYKSAWLLTHLAGIQATHREIVLKPHIPKDLDWVRASMDTLRGTIESSWKKSGEMIEWTVKVPPNCTATAVFPEGSGKATRVLEAGEHGFQFKVNAGAIDK